MLNIAVDFDGTFTADTVLWLTFMNEAKKAGHFVFIVTARNQEEDWCDLLSFIDKNGYEIFCTNGVAKKWYMQNIAGQRVDIWIDDKPEAIVANSTFTPEELDHWRATREY